MFFSALELVGVKAEREPSIAWLTNSFGVEEHETLGRIFETLNGDRDGLRTKRVMRLTPDGWLPHSRRLIEFDELQHFTPPRRQSLMLYPKGFRAGFDVSVYVRLCQEFSAKGVAKGAAGYRKPKVEFPFEGGRVSQRAMADSARDLLPELHGFGSTIRVHEWEVPSARKGKLEAVCAEVERVWKSRRLPLK